MVPHLVTALTGPINELEQRILESMPAIERWFRLEWMEHTPPFYCSVDLRNAGFKLAPVDTNLFPGGFNNLNPAFLPLCVQAAMTAIEKICPEARNLLIVPASGKPSSFYLASLARLEQIFRMAGLNVRFGSMDPAVKRSVTHKLPDGEDLVFEPALRSRCRLGLKHFDPCTILLNDDLPSGAPGILEDLNEQYLLPPLQAGWSVRRMSRHFRCYEEVSKRFGKLIGIDPWLIHPLFAHCERMDVRKPEGLDCLRENVNAVLLKLRRKYKDQFEKTHNGTRLGFMGFFIKAACEALKRFPAVNASIDGNDIVYHGYQDIGVAVSTDGGLVVPVLRDADFMSLADVEAAIRDLGIRARDNKLTIDDMTGGTFTVTNGGVFGSLLSTPILNPPQTGILGMHTIQERPVAVNGEVVIQPMMYLALSYDHRLIDGKTAVQFLVAIKDLIEDPARILLQL